MANDRIQRTVPWAGLLFLVVGVAAILLSSGIRSSGVTSVHDPGPRLLSSIVGWILIVGGLWEAFRVVRGGRETAAAAEGEPEPTAAADRMRAPGVGRRAIEFILGFPIYLVALTWLGFHLATGLMVTGLLCRLGVTWWRATLAGAVLVGAVHLVFGVVFRVVLPGGFWS